MHSCESPTSMAVPEEGLPLTPFIHQVGGHRGILSYNKNTICKPVIERELQNYHYLSPVLRDFMPKFKGVVEVLIEKDQEGDVTYKAMSAPCKYDVDCHAPTTKMPGNVELDLISSMDSKCSVDHKGDSGQIGDICNNQEPCFQNNQKNSPWQSIPPSHKGLETGDEIPTSGQVFEDATDYCFRPRGDGLNPWSLRVHHLELLRLSMGENKPFKMHANYMLLENVTEDYQCPSIIDLKIGTRCYGDDLSEEKKQLNIARALESTTNKLGVRFGGMQIYQPDKGTYICCNKKYGNILTEDDLRYEVGRFVYAKHRHCQQIRTSIIQRISQLRDAISRMDQYRFFGCSVLIIYEGKEAGTNDFSTGKNVGMEGTDDLSLSNMDVEGKSHGYNQSIALEDLDVDEQRSGKDSSNGGEYDENTGNVLVKIIDFAHSSSVEVSGMDGVKYEGIDKGFVYGLETLIELIREHPGKT